MGDRSVPRLPVVRLEVVSDTTATSRCDEGYLRVRRRSMVVHHPDAGRGDEFRYDVVERWNPDAVAVIPHFDRGGERWVLLRSAVRPPVALRPDPLPNAGHFPEGTECGVLWEIVAGLVEKDERSPEGLVRCAVRELEEEVGVELPATALRPLGGPIFPSAGTIGECIFFFEASFDPETRRTAHGDGPLEQGAVIVEVPLTEALAACDDGRLPDGKTEIAIRRLFARTRREGGVA